MKYPFFALLIFFAFACRPTAPIDETSPKFNFLTNIVPTSQRDTLLIRGNLRDGFRMDSIFAGDTAWFRIDIDGVFHALTEITISLSDNSRAEILLFPDQAYLDSTFLNFSDFTAGQFLVAGGRTRIPFKFGYHAIQSGANTLTLEALSQASDDYSTNNFSLSLPIRRTPPPQIRFPMGTTIVTEQNDSLQITIVSALHQLGALAIGDAVVLNIEIDGVRNNLTRLTMTPTNRTDAEITVLDTSNFVTYNFAGDTLRMEMDGTFRKLELPIRVYGMSANEDFGIIFRAYSDALFDYGVRRMELRTPIRELTILD